jgi:hypothetical protein
MFGCVVALVVLLLAGQTRAADRIPVVATFSVIGDMLANIGGDHIDIKTIVGAGGDCELYQPTAADVATVASARALFINDLNEEFEPWLEPLLGQALFKGTKVVVTRGVRTLTAEEEHPVSGRQLPAAIDQHAWLDPAMASFTCEISPRRCRASIQPTSRTSGRVRRPTQNRSRRSMTGRATRWRACRQESAGRWHRMIHCNISPVPMASRCWQ